MLLRAVAITLLVLGSGALGVGALKEQPQVIVCEAGCTVPRGADLLTHDTIDEGIAHIAVRASLPSPDPASLSRADLVELYLLLSVRSQAQEDQP